MPKSLNHRIRQWENNTLEVTDFTVRWAGDILSKSIVFGFLGLAGWAYMNTAQVKHVGDVYSFHDLPKVQSAVAYIEGTTRREAAIKTLFVEPYEAELLRAQQIAMEK